MKKYKIGIKDTDMCLRKVNINIENGMTANVSFSKDDEAIYEEETAKFYVEELNKHNEVEFHMKEV